MSGYRLLFPNSSGILRAFLAVALRFLVIDREIGKELFRDLPIPGKEENQ
jgi:hypothetical protein